MEKNPTKEEMLEAIKQSGYLFEQEIATILEANGFHVETNRAFEDVDTKKSREIDIYAIKRILHDEEKKINIFINLLCECKNNSSPFIFIGRNKNKRDEELNPLELSFPFQRYHKIIKKEGNTKTYAYISPIVHLKLEKKHLFYKSELKYVQFSKIVMDKGKLYANHEGIFDSIIMPMVKSLVYFKNEHPVKFGEWTDIWLHFPVVILNSDLLKLDSTQKEYSLEPEKYLSVMREIDSGNIKGTYLIDFTNKPNLELYLKDQMDLAKEIENIVKTKPYSIFKEEYESS
ncbi:MAG: hypothetical protein WC852_04150 [Candidatus Nanoarchaeia archaeon]|jgi:hypothetical protein